MGGKVTSGKNCEKDVSSSNCLKKDCRVRTACENGQVYRVPKRRGSNIYIFRRPSHKKMQKS